MLPDFHSVSTSAGELPEFREDRNPDRLAQTGLCRPNAGLSAILSAILSGFCPLTGPGQDFGFVLASVFEPLGSGVGNFDWLIFFRVAPFAASGSFPFITILSGGRHSVELQP